METLLTRHNRPRVYIETGTRSGEQIAIAAPLFEELHGVELNRHFYEVSKSAAASWPWARIHHGDSRNVLPFLLGISREPCFILLDAHYCRTNPPIEKSEFPLWDELKMIRARNFADIVVVDDVHTFGKQRPALRFKPDAKEWETVTRDSILAFFGDRVLDNDIVGDGLVVWLRS